MLFSDVFPVLSLLKYNEYPVMIPLASTALGGCQDTVMEIELTLNKLMLVGGPEGTTEQSILITQHKIVYTPIVFKFTHQNEMTIQ